MTRIISGSARGRKIAVPPSGTRPTADRAREGLFSSLQVRFGFENKMVLDLFAGSGALGLEAVSRGAALVSALPSTLYRRASSRVKSKPSPNSVNAPPADSAVSGVCSPIGVSSLAGAPRRRARAAAAARLHSWHGVSP